MEIPKPVILIEIPFCVKNQIASEQFIKKFNRFKSNPSKHLRDNIDHSFTWKVICNAPNRKLARKILEAYILLLIFLLQKMLD